MPGRANTCSTTTEPPTIRLKMYPLTVTTETIVLAKCVLADRLELRYALARAVRNEILIQDFKHLGTCHAGQIADLKQSQHHSRLNQRSKPLPELRPKRDIARRRQPAKISR